MNKGKICISVCAETADEVIRQINRAEDSADVIEIRFDCLSFHEREKILQNLPTEKPLLITLRTKDQGGKKEFTLKERSDFWKKISLFNGNNFYADFEADYSYFSTSVTAKKIWSQHYFDKVPRDLSADFDNPVRKDSSGIIKIAVKTDDITDAIKIWKLLEKAKSENKEIIPIAMGESGKWTRILGLAHGAFMTYASLDAESATAPGQVSAKDLIEVYRAKELDENTDVYGIIGGNTSYSMSPYMHNAAFNHHKLNAVFVPLQVQNSDEFIRRMVRGNSREIELNFKGFAVTIPHKQNIIKHLDYLDETAEKIGAVNTVKISDGKLYGFNTDAEGFIQPLLNSYGDLINAKVAVFGAGGAARACVYALVKNGAKVTIFARDLKKAETLAEDFQVSLKEFTPAENDKAKDDFNNFDIVVNTTPLGTKGEFEEQSILTGEQIKRVRLIYDLVYNPFQTKLLREAEKFDVPRIGGLAMLIAQAAAQQKIWTGLNAPVKEMSAEVLRRLK